MQGKLHFKGFLAKSYLCQFISTRSPDDYASLALCALNTLVTAMSSTLNFLSHTDESFKDETCVCGYTYT